MFRPARDEFSVMTYNLHQYGFHDRDGGGQPDDMKPIEERAVILAMLAGERPDILAIQEIGSPPVVDDFTNELAERGIDYPHREYLRHGAHENNMLVLSRYPIRARQSHTEDVYTIGDAKLPVARGFIDVEIAVNDDYAFRLMAAHLKSKVYHALGQTEMRRNEARLLNKHVRHALDADPGANLLVVGDLNDTYHSAPLREIMGKHERYLFDLRPSDVTGDVWTHFSRADDQYDRIDYMLVSQGMLPEVVTEKTHAVRWPGLMNASDHRPLVTVFKAYDCVMSRP
jgi:endonuclease/exonuclease/phosphatase family metal-dependent hydrolase